MSSLIRLASVFLLCTMVQAQTITVPIEVIPEPRAIFVTAEINGHEARLLLDTGALITLAHPARTGMTEEDLSQSTTIAAYDAHASRAIPVIQTDVRLGDLEFRVPVLFDSNLNLPGEFGKIDGLLGLNGLTQFDSFPDRSESAHLELSGLRK